LQKSRQEGVVWKKVKIKEKKRKYLAAAECRYDRTMHARALFGRERSNRLYRERQREKPT